MLRAGQGSYKGAQACSSHSSRPLPAPSGGRGGFLPTGQAPRHTAPAPRRTSRRPPQVTMLAGRPAAVEGFSAPPRHRPRSEVRWVSGCLLLPGYCRGLSRVLGRSSAPGSGGNCGPGVRQPSSRDRGPDRGALERRSGTRGAERDPSLAEAGDCARTRACALRKTPHAAAGLTPPLQKAAPPRRACAVPRRRLRGRLGRAAGARRLVEDQGAWAYCVREAKTRREVSHRFADPPTQPTYSASEPLRRLEKPLSQKM